MLRIEGQLAFTKPHLFGKFIFTRNPCWINLFFVRVSLECKDVED